MKYLEKNYRKDLKRRISDYVRDLLISDRYTNEQIGFVVKSIHMHTPIYLFLMILFAPYHYALFAYVFTCLVLCVFIYLYGCFLTLTEYKIDKTDVTMMDPVIMLCKDRITNKNRVNYSFLVITIYMIFATIIMCNRFYIKENSM